MVPTEHPAAIIYQYFISWREECPVTIALTTWTVGAAPRRATRCLCVCEFPVNITRGVGGTPGVSHDITETTIRRAIETELDLVGNTGVPSTILEEKVLGDG